MAGALQVWKSRAPAKCRFFLWLAVRDRCWTADMLERRRLPRPSACPFCDQAQESITHLLLLIAFWHGRYGLPVFDGGIERIGSLRVGSRSPIGYNPGVGGPQMPETTGPGLL
jgi:hypothetical protein